MAKLTFCEHCGGTDLSGTSEFVVFHRLSFCSPDCRDEYRTCRIDGVHVFRASGYPREIPGVPRERNLSGISFAVANVTGLLARLEHAALASLLAARRLECLGA